MYRLNMVVMIVLAVAVIGGAGFLALTSSEPATLDQAYVRKLFRKLSDPDPDLRREAEAEIRALGPRAREPLKEAADSADRVLADRASRLLRELSPAPVAEADPRKAAEPEREEPAPAKKSEGVTLFLSCIEERTRAGDTLHFYVRLKNEGPLPVVVARERLFRYARYARFEAADERGRVTKFRSEPPPPFEEEAPPDLVAVKAGEVLDFYAGQGDGRTLLTATGLARGGYRVSFVYDASEHGHYREALKGYAGPAVPLPLGRVVSNSLTLVVE